MQEVGGIRTPKLRGPDESIESVISAASTVAGIDVDNIHILFLRCEHTQSVSSADPQSETAGHVSQYVETRWA